ncbi:family 20 glycosylhydrolase [Marinilongibacter aquaticus]|uniref:beta-N-acetylhexosaminidase n=1 Tax=Marinilongibacter aquaticus TaxID=2975157 RepID=UPI0021BDEC96|nr:family 20 glycosylhydrolase [Marinilongibacter aquaticus]UBM58049.1 family 20 glycosylhydrolase [Marinilongibacter aquaticus]
MKTLLSLLCGLLCLTNVYAQNNLIPAPAKFETTDAFFMLDNSVAFDVRTDNADVAKYVSVFEDFLKKSSISLTHEKVESPSNTKRAIIVSLIDKSELANEGYTLEVKENEIAIQANKPAGIFYGLQTLRQLLPNEFESKNNPGLGMLNGCKITDYPRFAWRGLMLDVSRHFFTVDEVKAYLDKMAQYKFNVFHWHLTDDEGWRVEIKSLPKLTEVGAWRVPRNGSFGETRSYPKEGEKATYGGFYTQEQIKDVIAYAAERNITIVPEVDMPGHSMAALAAYPELSVNKEPKFVNPGAKFAEWHDDGTFDMLIENTLNPTDENVYSFVDKVFTEIAALFPGEYIHMGGDECYHGFWEKSPQVQKFMKKNNIKNTHELQSYFVKRVEKIINSKGKKMIGWDEILEGGLAENAAVMSWRGMKGGIEAAKLGHNVVMSPTTYAYLDYTQGDKSVENPIYADLSLEKTYSFEPIPDEVDAKYILGLQGNLWTEVVPTLQFAMYMTYPRALALAEIGWSQKEAKDWNSFINRTESAFSRFKASETNISTAVYEPIVSLKKEGDKLMCTLENHVQNVEMFYTIDNTYPVNFGTRYSGPFEIPEGKFNLRTQSFRNGRAIGRELIIPREDLEKRVK